MYPPEFIACVALYLAGEWASFQLQTNDDPTAPRWYDCISCGTQFIEIKNCALEFLEIMEKCPSRIKRILRTGPILSNVNDITLSSNKTDENGTEATAQGSTIDSKNYNNETETSAEPTNEATTAPLQDEVGKMADPIGTQDTNQIPVAQAQQAWDPANLVKTEKSSLNRSHSGSSILGECAPLLPSKRKRRSLSLDLTSLSPSQNNVKEIAANDDCDLNGKIKGRKLMKSLTTFEHSVTNDNMDDVGEPVANSVFDETHCVNSIISSAPNELNETASVKEENVSPMISEPHSEVDEEIDIEDHIQKEEDATCPPSPSHDEAVFSKYADDIKVTSNSNGEVENEYLPSSEMELPTQVELESTIPPEQVSQKTEEIECEVSNQSIELGATSPLSYNEAPSATHDPIGPDDNSISKISPTENAMCEFIEPTKNQLTSSLLPTPDNLPNMKHLSEGECEDSDSFSIANENPDQSV